MRQPFISSDRRVDLLKNLSGSEDDKALSRSVLMKDPFEKKDMDKQKDIEKKDLKETKDSKESKDADQFISDEVYRKSMSAKLNENASMEIGKRWKQRPPQLIDMDPPV